MSDKKKTTKKPEPDKRPTGEKKQLAMTNAIAEIEKKYGKGSIMKMGDRTTMEVDVIPTGSLAVDLALGVGGIPRGRIIEVFGPESSGKTTLTLHMVAETQKMGGTVAFIDAEHALDPDYAKALGVDIDSLLISQPDSGEQALEITDMLLRSYAIDLIVIDSVAALTPKSEIDGNIGDSHVGLHARLMSQALRKLAGTINRSGGIAVFINQLREKIGVTYGSPEVTTGGRALKFFSSVRIDIRKKEVIKSGSTPIGNRTKVKIAKNKVAPPFKEVEFDLIFGEGICPASEVIEFGEILGIIKKSGSWYSYNGERVGQGKESVKTMLKENPDAAVAIRKEILERKDEIFVIKKAKSKKDGKNKGKNNDADVDFEEEDIDEAAEEFEDEED